MKAGHDAPQLVQLMNAVEAAGIIATDEADRLLAEYDAHIAQSEALYAFLWPALNDLATKPMAEDVDREDFDRMLDKVAAGVVHVTLMREASDRIHARIAEVRNEEGGT